MGCVKKLRLEFGKVCSALMNSEIDYLKGSEKHRLGSGGTPMDLSDGIV
jgi:hypothetical protein